MRREQLIDAFRQRPFRPVRLYVSDGATYDIRHPEMLMVTRHAAFVGQPDAENPPPASEKVAVVDLLHITGLEPIDKAVSG